MPMVHQLDITAKTRVTQQGSVYVGRGTFTGKPFTRGRITTRTHVISLRPLRISTQVTIAAKGGQVILIFTAAGNGLRFYGTARVAFATGVYAGTTGSNVHVSIKGSAAKNTVRVKGKVKFANKTQPPTL